jgi:hypothetical protein
MVYLKVRKYAFRFLRALLERLPNLQLLMSSWDDLSDFRVPDNSFFGYIHVLTEMYRPLVTSTTISVVGCTGILP